MTNPSNPLLAGAMFLIPAALLCGRSWVRADSKLLLCEFFVVSIPLAFIADDRRLKADDKRKVNARCRREFLIDRHERDRSRGVNLRLLFVLAPLV